MNITDLPNDILKFIMDSYGYYKLLYVCKKFKNIVYDSLTKCDKCGKNVMFGKKVLWKSSMTSFIFNKCHGIKHYYNEYNIELFADKNIHKIIETLKSLNYINHKHKFIIGDIIEIIAQNDYTTQTLFDNTQHDLLDDIKGEYYIYIGNITKTNDPEILLKKSINKYTKNIKLSICITYNGVIQNEIYIFKD